MFCISSGFDVAEVFAEELEKSANNRRTARTSVRNKWL